MSTTAKARQNFQVAAVNAALERQLITLDCQPVEDTTFEFELLGLPAVGRVHDIGFDEVSIKAILDPTPLGQKFVSCTIWHGFRRFGVATVWGDLERRTGKYLQTVGTYHGRRDITEKLSGLTIVPNGFGVEPTEDGYDFRRECESVFGPPWKLGPVITPVARVPAGKFRAEFEPKLLAPLGFCNDAKSCAESWTSCSEEQLQDQVDRSIEWLQLCGTAPTVSRKSSSYGLKHEAERWWEAKGGGHGGYICNGALIMAALQIGMIVRRIGSSPNACLNLSQHRPVSDLRD
jgi:hypothetical protein